jgi:hypothetical protein
VAGARVRLYGRLHLGHVKRLFLFSAVPTASP